MPIIATENFRYSNLVKYELEPSIAFTREAVTVNEAAAKEYVIGTVLGKVTATGKYKISVQSATDGSEVAAAVVVEDKSVAATTDTKVLAIVRGPAMLSKAALVFDASYDLDAEKDAAYAALAAKNILVNTSV